MAELLQTERAYVKDLETCITCYLREMRTDPGAVPPALQGKVSSSHYNIHVGCWCSFWGKHFVIASNTQSIKSININLLGKCSAKRRFCRNQP